jgi:beta-glucosidase
MKMYRNFLSYLLLVVFLSFCSGTAGEEKIPDYKNPKQSIETRVDDLLGRMTLEEKIAQLGCLFGEVNLQKTVGAQGLGGLACTLRPLAAKAAAMHLNEIQKFFMEKTRLGIPVIMHDEALHGLLANQATSFPQAIALAATWDTLLMNQVANAIAQETKTRGIRQVLSPVVNIARDARWGRVEETYGEDPYLSARMGVAFCQAFEKLGIITTPKHFVANNGDGGRDSNPVHLNERILREIYFPPFEACVKEAGSLSIMAAYNSLDGTPCSANYWLLTDILRGEWGFQGFVVSDYGSVAGIYELHKTAATYQETAIQALQAGLEMELPNVWYYSEPLRQAVRSGLISEKIIDEAVRRILSVKFKIGLFENPYVDVQQAEKTNDCSEHRQLALRAAQKAIVLLKNENQILPLSKDLQSVALIGYDAASVRLGGYSGYGMSTVSILDGIRHKIGAQKVTYTQGFELRENVFPTIPEQYFLPPKGETAKQGLKAEYFNNMIFSGKPDLVRLDPQIHFDWGIDKPDEKINADRYSVRWTGRLRAPLTGKLLLGVTSDDGVRLWFNGQQVLDKWIDRGATTDVISVTVQQDSLYDLRLEYYENAVYAYADLSWNFGQKKNTDFKQVIELTRKSDAVIVVGGILEGEGQDRADLNLPAGQEKLIAAVAAMGKPTVVVLIGGSPITMQNWLSDVPAVLMAWYAGEEGGNAVADILFGDINPGGKLPISFPQTIGQVPLYYNYKPTGRGYGYIQVSGEPQFPFGYGLSFTEFAYRDLQLSAEKIPADDDLSVRFKIKNTGKVAGEEVVQLYIHDQTASVSRPVKELKRFKRVYLSPSEEQEITFKLDQSDLTMLDTKLNKVVEPGLFEIMIGSSSQDIRLHSNFEVITK